MSILIKLENFILTENEQGLYKLDLKDGFFSEHKCLKAAVIEFCLKYTLSKAEASCSPKEIKLIEDTSVYYQENDIWCSSCEDYAECLTTEGIQEGE